jgi:hypothetical protein
MIPVNLSSSLLTQGEKGEKRAKEENRENGQ